MTRGPRRAEGRLTSFDHLVGAAMTFGGGVNLPNLHGHCHAAECLPLRE
jgi:hypothetical protein